MNNKHLEKLARKIVKQDMEQYTFMQDDPELWVESQYKELSEVKQALLKGNYYTGVLSVSKTGMSRTIAIKYIKNNKLHCVSDSIYKLAGCDKNQRISGCGMDMLFAAQYNLFMALCPSMRYQDKMARYNSLI